MNQAVDKLTNEINAHLNADGSFHFCFENSLETDVKMILLLKTFTEDNLLIQQLCSRLAALQHKDGYWKLYEDDNGNLSATIEAVFALLYAGYYTKKSPEIKKASDYIKLKGGLTNAHSLTKITLALYGQYPWLNLMHLPVYIILLPPKSPLSFYDFSSYGRIHLAPILLVSDSRYTVKDTKIPDMSPFLLQRDLAPLDRNTRTLLLGVYQSIKALIGLPQQLYQSARQRLLLYMLQRTESDGTLYSYTTATFYMIYALRSAGYSKHHPSIQNAINGLKTHLCRTQKGYHTQNSPSAVWDTALLMYVLQMPPSPSYDLNAGVHYLLNQQHSYYGDWMMNLPSVSPGGWGFSTSNSIHPDVDDTTAALRAISPYASSNPVIQDRFVRGLNWVTAMQNDDGGWPAFEKDKTHPLLSYVPMDGAAHASLDPSTADLTGRTIEFLGHHAKFPKTDPRIHKAIQWLKKHQEPDGSWYGRWGISYIYGTWSALTGLSAVGLSTGDPCVHNGIQWLESIQNKDGGWGESCLSDEKEQYIPLKASTPSQTAWALDALISVHKQKTPTIERGIDSLLNQLEEETAWTYQYPTGAGLPGKFYVYYHSYNYIWPLLVLKKYLALVGTVNEEKQQGTPG
ncbi:prenyltransferase/squalene oxidase repeat-containing protein [Halobacillus litoralis]|uniref:terpene cyclase/mutase family protein n=1 Tax=Halobacillus litoralis TaxID=45668 RepID=UPI001CFC4ED6|nr:prenyltransferase/squalene oxidase repeat-containing protein [Halobacillus litoralis]